MDQYQLFHSLVYGDILKIAAKTDYSREYVGRVLNPAYYYYNEKIVTAAIELVNERKNKE